MLNTKIVPCGHLCCFREIHNLNILSRILRLANLNHAFAIKTNLLTLFRIAQWIRNDATTVEQIIAATVQMPVHPHICVRDQIIEVAAKSGGAWGNAKTRVSTF